MSNYFNPVKIVYTDDWENELSVKINDLNISNPVILTSPGNRNRFQIDEKFDQLSIFSNVNSNPTFLNCEDAINFCKNKNFDGVIALGGGSVMDLAKVVMAYLSIKITDLHELIGYKDSYSQEIPSIFLPTTHGTASEVTMWGTVWDMEEKKKYSISHSDLYPNFAILDPSLTITLPLEMSIITLMDALSHSFEAIWNKNKNDTSTEFAIDAISIILKNVNDLKFSPKDINVRKKLLLAANKAGLAFSQTKTAAAHSISYPLTIRYGIPHGIASSISLIPLLEINKKYIKKPLDKLCAQNGLSFRDLKQKVDLIPKNILAFRLRDWGIENKDLGMLVNESFTKGRMDNNIVELSKNDVGSILKKIL